jgi:hypothetical protein
LAFELKTYPEKKLLVQCALTMNVLKVSLVCAPREHKPNSYPKSYQRAVRVSKGEEEEQVAEKEEEPEEPEAQQHGWKPRQPKRQTGGTLEPTMQGALLLQAIISAGKGLHETVLDRYVSHDWCSTSGRI